LRQPRFAIWNPETRLGKRIFQLVSNTQEDVKMEPTTFTITREPAKLSTGDDVLFPLNIVDGWQPVTGAGMLTYKVRVFPLPLVTHSNFF